MTVPAIIDSHVHLWNPAQLRHPWLDGLPALNRSFDAADFMAATASENVRKFIVVEAGCEPGQSLKEVEWISDIANVEPRLRGIVAHAAVEEGQGVRGKLENLAHRPLVKGVRRNLQGELDRDYCLRREFIAGVRLLAQFKFTFDLCIRHDQLAAASELIRCVPEVVFVLDHLGKPNVRGHGFGPWANELKRLAESPNVVVKVSGLTTEADRHNWQSADLAPYLRHAFDCFGPDRLMFGSDWPVMTLATDYQRWIRLVLGLIPFRNEQEKIQIFQTNAKRIYRV